MNYEPKFDYEKESVFYRTKFPRLMAHLDAQILRNRRIIGAAEVRIRTLRFARDDMQSILNDGYRIIHPKEGYAPSNVNHEWDDGLDELDVPKSKEGERPL